MRNNQLDERIAKPVRDGLQKISNEKNIPIISASLHKMDFGAKNIHFPSFRPGYKSMYKQILSALEHSSSDIVFFTESDILYHSSHFDFVPKDKDIFYYNTNVWFLRMPDGHCLHYDVKQVSGLCVYKNVAIVHYRERVKLVEEKEKELPEVEFNRFIRYMGHEPFTHGRVQWQNQFKCETWKSEFPNVDIKHGDNLTGQRWRKDQYRNQQLLINWTESEEIPGWGKGIDLVKQLS